MGKLKITVITLFMLLVSTISFAVVKEPRELKSTYYKADELGYVPNEIIIKYKEDAANIIEQELKVKTKAADIRITKTLNGLNNKYKVKQIKPIFPNFRANQAKKASLLKKDVKLLTKKEKRLVRRLKRAPKEVKVPALDRIYKLTVELEDGQSLEDVAAEYNSDPAVEYAELNYIVRIFRTSNDEYYPMMWNLNNTGQMYPESGGYNPPPGTPDCDIDAPEAWEINVGSEDVIVAVIDTGVDYNHRDLYGNIWINEDEQAGDGNGDGRPGVANVDDDGDGLIDEDSKGREPNNPNWTNDLVNDDDENGYIDDIYGYDFCTTDQNRDSDPMDDGGHGTHCAGTIAARGDNALDIVGVCWKAKIMALKFLSWMGEGSWSDAAEAIYYATNNGADVLSNSWGGFYYYPPPVLEDAISYAWQNGVVTVAAAGNNNFENPVIYPAACSHVISVAATDSNDDKVSFSNYGEWVDIAAPGADILSLRAEDTYMGIIYDYHTTIASGTSMACPHVAGAAALLFSIDPELTPDDVNDILKDSADEIDDVDGTPVCDSGRLNVHQAIHLATVHKGFISLERDSYPCEGEIKIVLVDGDLNEEEECGVWVGVVSMRDYEYITLDITDTNIFVGSAYTDSGEPNIGDGIIQVADGDSIFAYYYDAYPIQEVVKTAPVDCQYPVISDIQIDMYGTEPTVIFDINEPAGGRVLCGTSCSGPNEVIVINYNLETSKSIKLKGVLPNTHYYYKVEAIDAAGNTTTDSNNGNCYEFITTAVDDVCVPGDYDTIQEAVDYCWDGGTVWIADGNYTGDGNRDIVVYGKGITIRGAGGEPNNCIIDCNGTEIELHRAFLIFSSQLDNNSPNISDLKITNGVQKRGGGMYIAQSNPVVGNCMISYNLSNGFRHGGGGVYIDKGNPIFSNCTINYNDAEGRTGSLYMRCGGGVFNYAGEPVFNSCEISYNEAIQYGGGVYNEYGSPSFNECEIKNNKATYSYGGGMCSYLGDVNLVGCDFIGNVAGCHGADGGGIAILFGHSTLTNCNFRQNTTRGGIGSGTGNGGGLRYCEPGGSFSGDSLTLINCTFTGNKAVGAGGGAAINSSSDLNVINCSFSDNLGEDWGGGIHLTNSNANLMNTIVCYNTTECGNCDGPQISVSMGTVNISYSNVAGGYDSILRTNGAVVNWGYGNIDEAPCFVDYTSDLHIMYNSPCINAGDPNFDPNIIDVDMDGEPRIMMGRVDMGADEVKGVYNIDQDNWYEHIQDAIDDANNGDEIAAAQGTYYETVDFGGKAITVRSGDPNDWSVVESTVINADGADQAVRFNSSEGSDSVLDGFTITGGTYGIRLYVSGPTISRCIITSNDSHGVYCEGYYGLQQPEIMNSKICNNSGNGINVYATRAPNVKNCWIYGNNSGVDAMVTVYAYEIYNSTIADNSDKGICQYWGSSPVISNCIVWGNGDDLYNCSATYSCISDCNDADGIGNICGDANDPLFVDDANDDYHIRPDSPCVDAGNPDYVPEQGETDIDGGQRIYAGIIDMGACEYEWIGLVNYWKLDEMEGITADDCIGDKDGTLTNMDPETDWVEGKINGALDFDGSGDYVSLPTVDALTGSEVTIAAWVSPGTVSGTRTVVFQGHYMYPSYHLYLVSGKATFGLGQWYFAQASEAFDPYEWHHIVGTYDGEYLRIYVDGDLKDTHYYYQQSGTAGNGSIGIFFMGGYCFDGVIDAVRVFDRALDDDEIEALYNSMN